MAQHPDCYTYRGGEKLALVKRPNQFVTRALPDTLAGAGLPQGEQMSSASTRITCPAEQLEGLMARARGFAVTHHAYDEAESGSEFLITDRVFVTFKDPLSAEDLAAFAGEHGLLQLEAYDDKNFLFQLTDATGMNPVKLVVKLSEGDARVAAAENDLNHRVATASLTLPLDPRYREQWHLHTHFTHPEVDHRASSLCEAAWEILDNYGDPETVVGVTDDGCRLDHRDFDSPQKFAAWGYFEGTRLVTDGDIDAEPGKMYQPGANHGTSCAGVTAGEVDGLLTVGAAPGCRLLPIKWESNGPFLLLNDSKLLTAINFLADKIDVMSNSWGQVPTQIFATPVVNRIRQLSTSGGRRNRGIVFLWAAGNDNCPIQHQANVDTPFTNGIDVVNGSLVWVGVRTARSFRNNLAEEPGVMKVAALASNARRSHYSNYGTGIDISAPTNNVHTYRRLNVDGLGVTTTRGNTVEDVTAGFGGTSSATPLVAGIAALVISANPALSAAEVISILKSTASKDLDMTGYPQTPPASFNQDTSWDVSPIAPFDAGDFQDIGHADGSWSPWFGHGRVDAAAAVSEAIARRPAQGFQEFESSPNREIPDADSNGIREEVEVTRAGGVAAIKVRIDIAHSWIGDLRIVLESPAGTRVVLHDRAGANADNIRQTFDSATTPGLAGFAGEDGQGTWTLIVEDHAARDIGTLEAWALIVNFAPDTSVAEDSEAVTIPDNDPDGITRELSLSGVGSIAEISLSVDITHPWVGDLRVVLTSPGGSVVVLQDRSGGSADNLVRTWRASNHPGLAGLIGEDPNGNWQLQVADRARRDVGKLNRWRIEVED